MPNFRGFGAPGGRKSLSPIDWRHRPYNSVRTNVLHCDDIGSSISRISIKLFADDTNLFIFNESIDILKVDAEEKIKLLNTWFVANKLCLSLEKNFLLVYLEKKRLKNLKST